MFETQYIIEIDNRFGEIHSLSGGPRGRSRRARVSFIDDDNIASYFLSYNTDNPTFVTDLETADVDGRGDESVIAGPKGSKLNFVIRTSLELQSSNFLYSQLGGTGLTISGADGTYRFLDTMVRITGATTGYRVDVPLRFVKKE